MLKLVSIHINKTAGTSFERILRDNYSKVYRINSHDGNRNRRSNSQDGDKLFDFVPDDTDVMHGHFKAHEVCGHGVPVITWVRDPVDRVISNYFYDLRQEKTNLKMMDYLADEPNRNKISKFLSGVELEQLLFIGVVEHIYKDISILVDTLNWKSKTIYHANATEYNKVSGDHLRKSIAFYNKLDVKLYKEILRLRGYDT